MGVVVISGFTVNHFTHVANFKKRKKQHEEHSKGTQTSIFIKSTFHSRPFFKIVTFNREL